MAPVVSPDNEKALDALGYEYPGHYEREQQRQPDFTIDSDPTTAAEPSPTQDHTQLITSHLQGLGRKCSKWLMLKNS